MAFCCLHRHHLGRMYSLSSKLIFGNTLNQSKSPKYFNICKNVISSCTRNRENTRKSAYARTQFHTSPQRYLNPMILLFAKQLVKVGAIISGRTVRKWWQHLPKDRRGHFKDWLFASRYKIALGTSGLGSIIFLYYMSHLQEAPITHRKRFIAFTPDQFLKISEFEANTYHEQYEKQKLPTSDLRHLHTTAIVNHIIQCNQDIEDFRHKQWTVTVIQDDDVTNAFVLPNGSIFVFTGLVNLCESPDQLATVLGHELAHVILNHGAELVGFAMFVDIFVIIMMAAIWTLMPSDGIAAVTQWFYHKVMDIIVHMPYSRQLEKEADEVGLQFSAKACFDIRECSAFWTLMDIEMDKKGQNVPEWLSTHPSNEKRAEYIDDLMNTALKMRESCNCARLPNTDPRTRHKTKKLEVKNEKTSNYAVI